MNEDWRLLGEGVIVQSVPKLVKEHRISATLPEERAFYGSSIQQFIDFMGEYERVLRQLFLQLGVTWKDVYLNSDVGSERLALADKMEIDQSDKVLDVGCGRGFFTVAAAHRAKSVVGLDLMNGLGRKGWWQRFNLTMQKLQLDHEVFGVKGSGAIMPFKNETFSIASSVHAIRNFQDLETIRNAFKEMKRVTKGGGRVIVVETLPLARNNTQEAHMKMFNCKVKYNRGELPYLAERELRSLLESSGLRISRIKAFDFNLSVAPPYFFLNISTLPEEQRAEAVREYNEAVEAVRKYGETSPPTLVAEAVVG